MKTITIRPSGPMLDFGRGYAAVLNNNVIASHFCSNDDWVKNDLGFKPHSSRKDLYDQLCPDGYDIVFSHEIFVSNEL